MSQVWESGQLSGKYRLLALLAGVSIVVDQATKIAVRENLPEYAAAIPLIPNMLNLVHAENRGAAWSMFEDAEWRMPFFIVMTLIAVVVILYSYHKVEEDDKVTAVGLALILGGAIGNFIDRVRFGSVTDFVQMYAGFEPLKGWVTSVFGSPYWPVYNVADVVIVVGVALVLIQGWFLEPKKETPESQPSS